MRKKLSIPTLAIVITSSSMLMSCNKQLYPDTSTKVEVQFFEQPRVIQVNSLGDLKLLFAELNYGVEMWNTVGYEIPQISFKGFGDAWVNNADDLPVETKKSIFFRLMTPLILASNQNILRERFMVENAPLSSRKLHNIAQKYDVINSENAILTESLRNELLQRVDILPVSLALVQAAKESGWGTSRFSHEGNAFFGQEDLAINGMLPINQYQEYDNYGVAKFNTPLDSVEAYMHNINTNVAYTNLRELRTELRSNEQQISGYKLASTLMHYSESGEAYTDSLRQMIRYNNLKLTDDMILDDDNFVHLVSSTKNINKSVLLDEW